MQWFFSSSAYSPSVYRLVYVSHCEFSQQFFEVVIINIIYHVEVCDLMGEMT